jgi:hypothetical protein
MKFTDYFKELFNDLLISLWDKSEKTALMRVIHALYVADNEFDKLEQKYFLEKLDDIDVDAKAVDAMPMADAFELLAKDKLKNRLVYIFMAEALFKDDDYDDLEASHVEAMKQRFPLSGEMLDEAIKQVRNKKLEVVLKEWIKDIQNTQL